MTTNAIRNTQTNTITTSVDTIYVFRIPSSFLLAGVLVLEGVSSLDKEDLVRDEVLNIVEEGSEDWIVGRVFTQQDRDPVEEYLMKCSNNVVSYSTYYSVFASVMQLSSIFIRGPIS